MAIDCKQALERLLVAEPAELTGRGDSELAAHLRVCPRCRAVGERLRADGEELARALAALGPPTGVEAALARVRRRRVPERVRRAWRVAIPLAAAAALAGVLLLRSAHVADRRGETQAVSLPAPRFEALVEAPAARNILVFETADESAKVIWFY